MSHCGLHRQVASPLLSRPNRVTGKQEFNKQKYVNYFVFFYAQYTRRSLLSKRHHKLQMTLKKYQQCMKRQQIAIDWWHWSLIIKCKHYHTFVKVLIKDQVAGETKSVYLQCVIIRHINIISRSIHSPQLSVQRAVLWWLWRHQKYWFRHDDTFQSNLKCSCCSLIGYKYAETFRVLVPPTELPYLYNYQLLSFIKKKSWKFIQAQYLRHRPQAANVSYIPWERGVFLGVNLTPCSLLRCDRSRERCWEVPCCKVRWRVVLWMHTCRRTFP